MAENWTKTSSPDWRWMNPNPLLALNHFTVPCSLTNSLPFFLKLFVLLGLPPEEKNCKFEPAGSPLNRKALQEQQTRGECNMPNPLQAIFDRRATSTVSEINLDGTPSSPQTSR